QARQWPPLDMSRLIFLVGEGPHDIGGLARGPMSTSDEPGFIQPIVSKVLHGPLVFKGRKLSVFGRKRVKGLKAAISHKAHLAAMLARDFDADVLVFVTDVDKN